VLSPEMGCPDKCVYSDVGATTTLAGTYGTSGTQDGIGTNAMFNQPKGVAVDTAGLVYVVDNNGLRKMVASTSRIYRPLHVCSTHTNNHMMCRNCDNCLFHHGWVLRSRHCWKRYICV
jgi:hypothetical protein